MSNTKTSTPETEIEDLRKQLQQLVSQLKDADASIEELSAVNEALQESIEENDATGKEVATKKKKVDIPTKSFKVGKQDYVFTVPQFTNPLAGHAVITAKEALTNDELLKYLIENDCGVAERKTK